MISAIALGDIYQWEDGDGDGSFNGLEEWNKIFGGTEGEYGNSVQQTEDGGFIIAGYENTDGYLVRINSSGDTLWTKLYEGSNQDRFFSRSGLKIIKLHQAILYHLTFNG